MRHAPKLAVMLAALALLVSPQAHADSLTVVGVDPEGDHELFGPDAPAFSELVQIMIGETTDTIDFVWRMKDLPDGVGQVPEFEWHFWDLEIDDPNDGDPSELFEVDARTPVVPGVVGGGELASNCTTTVNVIECEPVPGAVVDVVVDDVLNTVTAKVRRQDMKGDSGNSLAVDGAVITEVDIFDGISVCSGLGVYSSGFCDEADMSVDPDGQYVIGSAA